MKAQLFYFLSFICLANNSVSQIRDNQWLIWNTRGKQSTNSSSLNVYPSTNVLTSDFSLTGIKSPDIVNIPDARIDLFVIYKNGEHFNSRYLPDPQYFHSNPVQTGMANLFQPNPPTQVEYLYLTRRYEIDDPPAGVSAMSSSSGGSPTIYQVDNTPSGLISANHDIVINKDISLIIRYSSLDSMLEINSQRPGFKLDSIFTLQFDGLRNRNTNEFTCCHNLLNPEPVFGTVITGPLTSVNPGNTLISATGEQVVLRPSGNYGYLNLRPSETIISYGPDPRDIDGNPRYDAVFTLSIAGAPVGQLAEPIRLSHDPNFLRVESICRLKEGGHIVTYHLQFENTSNQFTTELGAHVTFPTQFDLNCAEAIKWDAAGKKCGGKTKLVGRTLTFDFSGEDPLYKCTSTNDTQGIGFVKFKVMVSPGVDVTDLGVSLKLDDPNAVFDSKDFPVTEFRDLIVCTSEGKPGDNLYFSTELPAKFKRPHKSGKSDKQEKPDSLSKEENPNPNPPPDDEKNEKEPLKELASFKNVGAINCFRPIETGKCNCLKKSFLVPVVIVLLALALLTIIFKKVIKNKKAKAKVVSTPPQDS